MQRTTEDCTEAEALVVTSEHGARHPKGVVGRLLFTTALLWSLFQLWYASPLPFTFGFGVFNDTEARSIHLAFALFLAFCAFPARHSSPRHKIPWHDWLMAVAAGLCAAYLLIFYEELSERPGLPTSLDIAVGVIGMVLLLEATRRSLGPPLLVVASLFLIYTFGGPHMPEVIAHKGQSLSKVLSHQWLTTEGVFGVALGVSTSFVFLFVLFGALLERAGAGNYFIQLSFALLGHMRGGPAKAAVVASAATGLISGSSIANVATTGTFTIPLMKRVGFPGTKAGAVEVASSTNGQLTPPVMGAAAFLMIEYVGISYLEVIKHALLPALISYFALFYIVHLEALKANMVGMKQRHPTTLSQKLMTSAGVISGLCLLTLGVYYGIGWIKIVAGVWAIYIVALLVVAAYLGLLYYASRYPELHLDSPDKPLLETPETGPTVKSGLHFLLPIVVLMWCLVVERFSPGLSAFWATLFMIIIVTTQRPLLAYFRGHSRDGEMVRGLSECIDGLVNGARNMVGIGVATAAAGIVVGTITLTGIGQVMIEFVEFISGGNLLLALIFTAVICIILGMGLPTTANYIVVSSLMAPVLVALASSNGLVLPLIAVHLFVFYFGILADDTPPVGLAAFAAAAIARSDPIRTGIQGFAYDIRTAILPFLFIFNTQLLLIGIDSLLELLLIISSATLAMLLFAAATQGYWLTRSRWWETLALLLIAFTLFRPGYWWDKIYPATETIPATAIHQIAHQLPADKSLRMVASGENIDGDWQQLTINLPLDNGESGEQRLTDAGLELTIQDGRVTAESVGYGSPAQLAGLDLGWEIESLQISADRPPKQWVFLPALLLLLTIGWRQKRRSRQDLNSG